MGEAGCAVAVMRAVLLSARCHAGKLCFHYMLKIGSKETFKAMFLQASICIRIYSGTPRRPFKVQAPKKGSKQVKERSHPKISQPMLACSRDPIYAFPAIL